MAGRPMDPHTSILKIVQLCYCMSWDFYVCRFLKSWRLALFGNKFKKKFVQSAQLPWGYTITTSKFQQQYAQMVASRFVICKIAKKKLCTKILWYMVLSIACFISHHSPTFKSYFKVPNKTTHFLQQTSLNFVPLVSLFICCTRRLFEELPG